MIDIENYNRAIQWLERGMTAQAFEPDSETLRHSVMLSFEVTYNLSESVLRQAIIKVADDPEAAWLSSRELMRYATDEGMPLSSAETWLRYGISLEQVNATQGEAFSEQLAPFLPQYVKELQSFSRYLERRLV